MHHFFGEFGTEETFATDECDIYAADASHGLIAQAEPHRIPDSQSADQDSGSAGSPDGHTQVGAPKMCEAAQDEVTDPHLSPARR